MNRFFNALRHALQIVECAPSAEGAVIRLALEARKERNRVFFIGNGGSAAIASHMAADWTLNGHIPATALNDGPALTCAANDFGYEHVFTEQLRRHAGPNSVLIAISSSGRSTNIVEACRTLKAFVPAVSVVTLSGFDPDNPLRTSGGINFYVPSHSYGIVETAHLAILHAILDKVVESSKE